MCETKLGLSERTQLENTHRITNTSFNTLLGLFQHYGLSQTRGMSATVSGPMPVLVIKQRTLQENILSPCFAVSQTEVFKLKSWEPRVVGNILGYRIIPDNTSEERFRMSHSIIFWVVFKIC